MHTKLLQYDKKLAKISFFLYFFVILIILFKIFPPIFKFEKMVATARVTNPSVINYMFLAMKFGRPPMFASGGTSDFANRLRSFESIIDTAYRANKRTYNHTR